MCKCTNFLFIERSQERKKFTKTRTHSHCIDIYTDRVPRITMKMIKSDKIE